MRIDAHQHFWTYDVAAYGWIPTGSNLARDYQPDDLWPQLHQAKIDGTIAVQARQSDAETDWLVGLATVHPWILGVVGWIDLSAPDIHDRLDRHTGRPAIVGYRHVVQDEADEDFLMRPAILGGIRSVLDHGLSYDLLITPRHSKATIRFLDRIGPGRLILDHCGKPDIASGEWNQWARDIEEMARAPSLYCKISGLVTQADPADWRVDDLDRYLDHVLACFGPERLIFGSDWPVCRLGSNYAKVVEIIDQFVDRACPEHRSAIFGDTAVTAYNLRESYP